MCMTDGQEFPVVLSGTDVLMWAKENTVEPGAQQQLRMIAGLPWVHGVRVMPDVHQGIGATVGSVIAMRSAVAPAAVGVDIGCGMIGVPTSLTSEDLPDDLSRLRAEVEAAIPVGFNAHKRIVDVDKLDVGSGWSNFWSKFSSLDPAVHKLESRAAHQMGTLGGGNHFIELTTATDGQVWLMLHSGSRGIGNQLAQRHMQIAKKLPHNADITHADMSVFLSATPQMEAYLRDLRWSQEYALRNRAVMMALFKNVVRQHFLARDVTFGTEIQCHHNYVAEEHYDDQDVIVTRKGAIFAGSGTMGLIPGSMGTASYVVRGLGNPESYCSASHGAGRRMSRTKAKKSFAVADLVAQTAGVECRKDRGVLDEIPAAYKDLDSVLDAQKDLVEVVTKLTTLLCVKG